MSLYAITWALASSEAKGNDRLVVIVLAHHTDDEGYAGLSKATLALETRLSESTILRCQETLVTIREITRVVGQNGPTWWLDIPVNRRPKLFKMTAFLGSHFATPTKSGVSQGSHRGVSGVHDTPSDQGVRDVNSLSLERLNNGAQPKNENDKDPDPKCIRCRGRGTFQAAEGDSSYQGAGPFQRRCTCTYVVDPAMALVAQ